jgi:hypothetical protein
MQALMTRDSFIPAGAKAQRELRALHHFTTHGLKKIPKKNFF